MKLDKDFDSDVIVYAFRYTLGRHSYAPSLMRDKLDEVWNSIDEFKQELILREIIEHKEFLDRIYVDKEIGFHDDYDLREWLNWREKKLWEKEHGR